MSEWHLVISLFKMELRAYNPSTGKEDEEG